MLGVFSLSSISMELLLAVQTNCRGRRSLRSAVLHGLGQLWPDTGEMSDGRGNGGRSRREKERERREKIPAGVCDVAQRIMAGYDVWRLNLKKDKKKDKIP